MCLCVCVCYVLCLCVCADKDDSKTIEVDELQTALKEKLGIDKSKEDLEAAFKEVNEGKDSKSIDEATFKTLVAKFKK